MTVTERASGSIRGFLVSQHGSAVGETLPSLKGPAGNWLVRALFHHPVRPSLPTCSASATFVGCSQSLISLRFSSCYAFRRHAIKNGLEQGHGTQSNRLGIKDLWPSAGRFWHLIKPGLKRSKTQILTLSDPKIRGQEPKTLSKRAHNPLLKEAGLTKPTAAHPSGGPVAGGAIGTSGMPLTA